MIKSGKKLSKLKGMMKKWHNLGRTSHSSSIAATPCNDTWQVPSVSGDKIPTGFQPVYVGKSRRRYLISSELIDHPLFGELIEKSGGESDAITVGCEVVLFEHLLWMLENADPRPESLDEIVGFYAC